MSVTVKELSEQLNISKQAVLKRINNLPADKKPIKQNGSYQIDKETAELIKNNTKEKQPTDNHKQTTDNQPDKFVEELINDKKELYRLLSEKDEQLKQANKLLEQQQILTLQANQRIELLESNTRLDDTDNQQPTDNQEQPIDKVKPTQKDNLFSRLFKRK